MIRAMRTPLRYRIETFLYTAQLRLRAAWHELRCVECRVSWASWRSRLIRGY